MNIFLKFWNNFKSQPDVWFFYGFLLAFTITIRKVLVFYPVAGQFNEWSGIYLYLSDVFLFLALSIWAVNILRNNYDKLSIANVKLWLNRAIVYLPLLLVFWSFASIFWSENQNIALFRAIKLLEFYLLYLYIIFRIVPPRKECSTPEGMFHVEHPTGQAWNILRGRRETILKNTFRIVIVLGFIQAIIGIWQFIIQHSIGLFWLKESLISPNIDGVAKIVLHGEKFIRSYGLFPHPNILGGFLVISIILTWAYSKLFRACPVEQNCSTPVRMFHVEHPTGQAWNILPVRHETILVFLASIQIIALILTFSKSAIIGLLIVISYILWKSKKIFHMKHLKNKATIVLIILILSLYLTGLNFGDNLEKSYDDRVNQLAVWKSTAQSNLLLGVGAGNYMFHVEQNYPDLDTWQYQPIHNVFLLIQAEFGFVGVFIFILFLWKLLKSRGLFHVKHLSSVLPLPRGGSEGGVIIFKGILLAFIFIMLFDHYPWDIQQGQIMLWLIFGFMASLSQKRCN